MSFEAKLGLINEYIDRSKTIYIMMHSDSDLDAIGSAIGLAEHFKRKHKECFIINDDKRMESGVRKVYNTFKTKYNFVRSVGLITKITSDDLLVVVDTSNPKLIDNIELMEKFKTVINIDHHDTSKKVIEADLSIIDDFASSTSEMIVHYISRDKNEVVSPEVATVLLAGIVLDTNGYSIKTTERTFVSSAYLMKCGADNKEVQYLLKQDLKEYMQRQKVINSVKNINGIAVSKGLQKIIYRREDLAKIADSLLFFNNIKASFVVGKVSKEEVGISARSYGEVNVGKLLQSFGGGGDEEGAAARITNTSVEETYRRLLEKLKEIG